MKMENNRAVAVQRRLQQRIVMGDNVADTNDAGGD